LLPLTVSDAPHLLTISDLLGWVGSANEQFPPTTGGRPTRRLARAVIMSPEVILAINRPGNVDWEMSQRLPSLLVELNKMGETILIVYDISPLPPRRRCSRAYRFRIRRLQPVGADL
jgi:cell division transport system ATP-binding protein